MTDENQEIETVEEEVVKERPEEIAEKTQEENPVEVDQEEIARKEKAKQDFLERQRKKAVETSRNIQTRSNEDDDYQEEVKILVQQMKMQKVLEADKKAFNQMEGEFKQHITDYDDVVNSAMEATKMRLMSQGMSEVEASNAIEYEKIVLANNAYRSGKDPVEAVYNEAKGINDWIDKLAETRGYKRTQDTKTKMQALREAAKPNAMTGGKGTTAVSKTFDEEDDLDTINRVTLAELLNQ